MNEIEKEIETNQLILRMLDELDSHFKKSEIDITNHSFGALKQKISEDILKLEMKTEIPKEEQNGLSDSDLLNILRNNRQLMDMVITFGGQSET